MSLPDFLCIGAQKAGTTWLDAQLRHHPNLWLPPAKELHYFDRGTPAYVSMLLDADPAKRMLVLNRFKFALRDVALRAMRPADCLYTMGWYGRFLFLPRSDRWYASLFAPGAQQRAGEVTPAYALLPEPEVRRIHGQMPGVKCIYLLRNPVERAWSEAAMHFSRSGHGRHGYSRNGHSRCGRVDPAHAQTVLGQPSTLRHSCYTKTLSIWEKFFPEEQIFVGFFEQMERSPRQLLLDIFRFLGVPASEAYISPQVHQKVFPNQHRYRMPDSVRQQLTERLFPELVALHDRFDNAYTESWLNAASAIHYNSKSLA